MRSLGTRSEGTGEPAEERGLAYDSYGNPRPRRQPMSTRQRADLERRFPGIGIA